MFWLPVLLKMELTPLTGLLFASLRVRLILARSVPLALMLEEGDAASTEFPSETAPAE